MIGINAMLLKCWGRWFLATLNNDIFQHLKAKLVTTGSG
jgi:hypothetical protein